MGSHFKILGALAIIILATSIAIFSFVDETTLNEVFGQSLIDIKWRKTITEIEDDQKALHAVLEILNRLECPGGADLCKSKLVNSIVEKTKAELECEQIRFDLNFENGVENELRRRRERTSPTSSELLQLKKYAKEVKPIVARISAINSCKSKRGLSLVLLCKPGTKTKSQLDECSFQVHKPTMLEKPLADPQLAPSPRPVTNFYVTWTKIIAERMSIEVRNPSDQNMEPTLDCIDNDVTGESASECMAQVIAQGAQPGVYSIQVNCVRDANYTVEVARYESGDPAIKFMGSCKDNEVILYKFRFDPNTKPQLSRVSP